MLAFELIKNLKKIPENTPIVFVGDDGVWSNIDIEFKDGQLNIKQEDYDGIFSSDKAELIGAVMAKGGE